MIKHYWSTPIGEYALSDLSLERHVNSLLRKQYDVGEEFNLLPEGDVFLNWVHSCARDYVSSFYDLQTEIDMVRSWVNTQKPLEDLPVHSHAPVDFVGVFYLNYNDNHPSLQVYDPRPPHKFNEVSFGSVNCARHIDIKTEKNKLVFFPGYLLHGVRSNMTRDIRQSLAMNFKIRNK
jgi:hypothetical protein